MNYRGGRNCFSEKAVKYFMIVAAIIYLAATAFLVSQGLGFLAVIIFFVGIGQYLSRKMYRIERMGDIQDMRRMDRYAREHFRDEEDEVYEEDLEEYHKFKAEQRRKRKEANQLEQKRTIDV